MADGRDDSPALNLRKTFTWMEIFRCFQVALDPQKLLVAALGIFAMSLGWWVLSWAAYQGPPNRDNPEYSNQSIQRQLGEQPATEAELKALGDHQFHQDLAVWRFQRDLAGPNGRLRTMPWDEYRGPNPYLLITSLFGGDTVQRDFAVQQFFTGTLPVLIEPLVKMLLPVVKFVDPNASTGTRFYLLLCLVWSLAVWAFCGGIITRMAALKLTGKGEPDARESVRFVVRRYTSYITSSLIPLGVMALLVIAMAVYGLIAMIPVLGDFVLYGLFLPVIFMGGIIMAILLVGLVGYPMMYTTISTEGSESFDALSRSYNYVFQAPWTYLGYAAVAIAYGAIVTLFVVLMASLAVYFGKWAVSQAPWNEYNGRKPDFLFVHAPDSFGWRELFLEGTPIAINARKPALNVDAADLERPQSIEYVYEDPAAAEIYNNRIWGLEKVGAWMVTFWLVLAFMMMLGFSYSYFWVAATMIYLLMRQKIDETELDEIYLEDDFPTAPIHPPVSYPMPPSAGKSSSSLPVVAPPSSSGPATLPLYSGPASPPPASPPPAPAPTVDTTPPTTPVSPPAPTGEAKAAPEPSPASTGEAQPTTDASPKPEDKKS